MNFLYPSFLLALFAIAIPILIHLFSFRKFITVYFSNVSYLKNIKKEAQKRSRIRNLLILISRILAVSALVFAFSQPYIPASRLHHQQANPVVSIYIDNSFSMNALSTQGQLLEIARNRALEIASSYPTGTRFRILTNDLLPQHQHLFNKEQLIQQISEIKSSSRTVRLSLINSRMAGIMAGMEEPYPVTAYYLSDFQTRSSDLQGFSNDSNLINYLMPLSPEITANLFIDSCWMEFPAHKIDQEERLNVRIVNQSGQAYQNLPVRFFLNDTLKALANFNIDAGGTETVVLKYINLKSGLHLGHAEISDYPFTHDNTWYLSYQVLSQLKALAVYDPGNRSGSGLPYLRALLADDNYILMDESSVENLRISNLDEYNAIILLNIREFSSGLINELKKAAGNGATLIFFPELSGKTESYNNFLAVMNANRITRMDTTHKEIAGIDWKHPVYEQAFKDRSGEIDFPAIKGNFDFTRDIRIAETPLLWFRNGAKAVSSQNAGNGNLIIFSFPLSPENDEFARDILFVPTIYSLIINSLPRQKMAYTIGKESFAILPRQPLPEVPALSVLSKETNLEFIPEMSAMEGNRLKIAFSDYLNTAGHYMVQNRGDIFSAISMNYDRDESILTYNTPSELNSLIERYHLKYAYVIEDQGKTFSEILNETQTGKQLWKLFLVFTLLFLAAEALIIRFWK